jgi:tRNA(Ile)-lysidine synthetase-like protein
MDTTAKQVEAPVQHRLIQETLAFMRRRALVADGDKVLVAVSGGLDSSVLLHTLARIARSLGVVVEVAHIDHGTRGESSEREALWVKVLAERLHLKLHPLRLMPPERANQEELRNLRRAALAELAKDLGCRRIATAHHADDNAETFLMRAMSGTGTNGLAGIRPKDGPWIKPLLWATRSDLEDYARVHRLAWVEDPSNERGVYLRNHIRNVLIPQLEETRSGSLRNLARAAERLEEEESAWDLWLDTQLEGPKETLSVAWLERWPAPLQRRVLRFWLKRLGLVSQPALVEALLRGDELVHPAGSFLRRSDMLIFSAETEFGQLWQDALPLEISKRTAFGASLGWSFLPSSTIRQSPVSLSLMPAFTRPGQRLGAGTLLLSWERTPWPLAVRSMQASELARFQQILKAFGVPKPYWRQWPVIVSQDKTSEVVALFGLKVLEPYEAQGGERSVSIAHFFEESLKPV